MLYTSGGSAGAGRKAHCVAFLSLFGRSNGALHSYSCTESRTVEYSEKFQIRVDRPKKKNLPAREKQLGPSLGPPKQEKDHLSEGGAKFGKIKKSPL